MNGLSKKILAFLKLTREGKTTAINKNYQLNSTHLQDAFKKGQNLSFSVTCGLL